MSIGLRIDVDTLRGTRDGVPRLLAILERRRVRATWFVTLGPDNMGRHVRRLLRPSFALKMMRSGAASLYGWDIVLRGTLWPGPVISQRCIEVLRRPDRAGHEVALHAWDHHRWQVGTDTLADAALDAELVRAKEAFAQVYDREPDACAAAPCAFTLAPLAGLAWLVTYSTALPMMSPSVSSCPTVRISAATLLSAPFSRANVPARVTEA